MAKRNIFRGLAAVLALGMCMTGLAGCGSEKRADGKTEIEVVSYKPEAVKAFEKIEKRGKCTPSYRDFFKILFIAARPRSTEQQIRLRPTPSAAAISALLMPRR